MKKSLFLDSLAGKSFLLLSSLFLIWSCEKNVQGSEPEPEPDPGPEVTFELVASTDFGCSVDDLKASQELAGNEVGPYDAATRTLKVTTSDTLQTEVLYYFDAENNYRYGLITVSSFEDLNTVLMPLISEDGWTAYQTTATPPAYESLFSKDNVLMRIFTEESEAQATPAILLGPVDETILSWTRTDVITDPVTGVFTPLVAFGASLDLVRKFELFQGHTVNSERTNPDNQFYAFDTGDEKFPMMGYWFDIDTDTFLEECALYVEPDSRPTPDEINTYVNGLGFEYTYLTDGNNNPIFYDRETMTVCCAEMMEPESGVFSPKLRFWIQDLTEQLPKETVIIPWPNMEFGQLTMDEALEWFENQGYEVDPTGFMEVFPLITTGGEDFDQIILLPDDNGMYAGAYVMTSDLRVIKSPDIEKQLLEKGFEPVSGAILQTYHNEELNVEVQIDLSAMFGAYAIAFNQIGA